MTRRSDKPERPSRSQKSSASARAKKPADAADDLPTLEPMEGADAAEELPVLEAIDEAPPEPTFLVRLVVVPSTEPGFDTSITLEVPEMEKKGMADAIEAPLAHAFASGKAKVRHHRVLVTFSGDAIIGSGVKERCSQLFTAQKARKVVLRRGYGDETLFEREAPRAQVAVTKNGNNLDVAVDTGDLETQDLSVALQADLVQLAGQCRGARVQFRFAGANKPDAALRTLIEQMLRDSGALRAAFGQRVLFDRELEDRVRIEVAADAVTVRVAPAASDAETEEALAMRLGSLGDQVRGKVVRIAFATKESDDVRSATVRYCTQGAPQRIEIAREAGNEVVWPSLLTVGDHAGETTLTAVPNGRDRASMLAAFVAETRDFRAVVGGKKVVVLWPEGTQLDAALEQACVDPLVALSAARVVIACGNERDVVHPAPVASSDAGGELVVRVDTEAGKPAELQRAFDRWQKRSGDRLSGQSARLLFAGEVAPSRTLVRTLTDATLAKKPQRLVVETGGRADVVWPQFLKVAGSAQNGFSISCETAGRDEAQAKLALERELAAVQGLSGAVATIDAGAHEAMLMAAILGAGARAVVVGGVQVHPALLAVATKKGAVSITASPDAGPEMATKQLARELETALAGGVDGKTVTITWPSGDPKSEPLATLVREVVARGAAVVRVDDGSGNAVQVHPVVAPKVEPQKPATAVVEPAANVGSESDLAELVAEDVPEIPVEPVVVLGKNDAVTPGLVLLAIAMDDRADQPQRVRDALAAMVQQLTGRRVLLIGSYRGSETPFLGMSPVVVAARGIVDAHAAATLCFRGKDALGRGCFGVARSSIEGLAFGANFADPRVR